MQTIEQSMDEILVKYLKPIDENWQPADLLPDASSPTFFQEILEIQELSREMGYDLWAVLIGDTITEEALPTYESWLMDVDGVDNVKRNGWSQWVRSWTAEENRHGDLLNKYLYLSGRVNMREMETSTQYLISDGFDIGTARDPYKNFIYTSFQELATNVSHRRVGGLAKKAGNLRLANICNLISIDEARHAKAYGDFVNMIFKMDPSEMMLAFEYMMRIKIVMPAHFMRETGSPVNEAFAHFSDAAQRLQVYTSTDYIAIFNALLKQWDIGNMTGLNDKAEKARDFIMGLPKRLQLIAERSKVPEKQHQFKWIANAGQPIQLP
jgi:acyl-[acyl-carrier-protein] desaturase